MVTAVVRTKQYDDAIKAAAQRYLPFWPWQWLLAQYMQESGLDPTAQNPVSGAKGMPQFMDPTWEDERRALGYPDTASPFDPKFAIPAGAHYMSLMRSFWTAPRPEADRRRFALASYNAGPGNVLRAQSLAGGASDFASVAAKLPHVTGEANAKETTDYVRHIEAYFVQFSAEA